MQKDQDLIYYDLQNLTELYSKSWKYVATPPLQG